MLRQYAPTCSRTRLTQTPRGPLWTGTIPVGSIIRPHSCQGNIEVLAWLPRDYASYENGRFTTKRIRGGHLAMVRNLANGSTFTLSDAWLIDAPSNEGRKM